ncbi:MAG: hypothetical protein QXO51_03545 [Halobacteria archaeon]
MRRPQHPGMAASAVAAALLLLLTGTAQAAWSDVRFQNLTATPHGGGFFFRVVLVNTADEPAGGPVSFGVSGPGGDMGFCPERLELAPLERRTLECHAVVSGPSGNYTMTFGSESVRFAAGDRPAPPSASPPSPVPSPASRSTSGFEALAAAAALAAALALFPRRGR